MMRKIISIWMMVGMCLQIANAQTVNENAVLEMAKIYKKFYAQTSPSAEVYTKLKSFKTPQTKTSVEFIRQCINTNNSLTSKSYLALPDSGTLTFLYLVKQTAVKLAEEEGKDNIELVKKLEANPVSKYELVANYYSMLFNSVYYKVHPFNLSKTNFQVDKYGLKDETSRGIFVLQLINVCSKALYMEDTSRNNFISVYQVIQRFPKINGLDYYKFTDFNFPDFQIALGNKAESYKGYYMDKYFSVLFTHLDCLQNCQKNNYVNSKKELINTSILNEPAYRKYCKDQEALKKIVPSVVMD